MQQRWFIDFLSRLKLGRATSPPCPEGTLRLYVLGDDDHS
jgi:hypothetical protein